MNFWTDQGKVLFTGLLGAAALSEQRSMRDVAEWVFNMSMPGSEAGCPPAEILDVALAKADDPRRRRRGGAAPGGDLEQSRPQAAVVGVLHRHHGRRPRGSTRTSLAATDLDPDKPGEWVDLDWLMDTGPDGDKANTLYLLVSHDDYQRLSPVLAGLLSDIKAQAYEWESVGRKFPAPLLMLIDEAGNMPLDWLPEVSSTCAGLGIQLVTVWQSLAQIDRVLRAARRRPVDQPRHQAVLPGRVGRLDAQLPVEDRRRRRRRTTVLVDRPQRRRPPLDLRAGEPRVARPVLPGPPPRLRAGVDDPLQHPARPDRRAPLVEGPPPRRDGPRRRRRPAPPDATTAPARGTPPPRRRPDRRRPGRRDQPSRRRRRRRASTRSPARSPPTSTKEMSDAR